MSAMSEQPPNPPYGEPQNPYGQGGQPDPYAQGGQGGQGGQGYPQAPYGGYGAPPADHHQATTVLVLGIISLVLCQILGPFAWVMGNRVVREIDAAGGTVGGRSTANAGRICGIIASALLGLSILLLIGVVLVALVAASQSAT
jgi:hypothetical protein